MKLRSENIVVFGGGSGIGKAIAKRLHDAGSQVVLCGRTPEKLEEARREMGTDGVFIAPFDITNIAGHPDFFAHCQNLMGGLGGFVNAAALGPHNVTGRGYEPWDITEEEWDTLTNTNFKAAFFLMRNQVDYMLARNIRGNILNLASNAACMQILGSYGAAKQAVIRWTRAFGSKFGHNGIIINGIAPGATFTPMIASYAHDLEQKYERHAIERFIRPEEIAELAFYLMSNMGEIVCGHTVVADGGDKPAVL